MVYRSATYVVRESEFVLLASYQIISPVGPLREDAPGSDATEENSAAAGQRHY